MNEYLPYGNLLEPNYGDPYSDFTVMPVSGVQKAPADTTSLQPVDPSAMTLEQYLASLPKTTPASTMAMSNPLAVQNAGLPAGLHYTDVTQNLNPNYDPNAAFSLPFGAEFTMTPEEIRNAQLNWAYNNAQYQPKSWTISTGPTGAGAVNMSLVSGNPYVLRNNKTGEIVAQGSDDATLARIAGLISGGSLGDEWQLFQPSTSSYGNITAGQPNAWGNTGYGNSEYVKGANGQPGYWLNPIAGARPAPSLLGQLAKTAAMVWGLPIAGAYLAPALGGGVLGGIGAGAATGAAGSAIQGGDILKGALLGGLAGGALSGAGKVLGSSTSGGSSGGGGGGAGADGEIVVNAPTASTGFYTPLSGYSDTPNQPSTQQTAYEPGMEYPATTVSHALPGVGGIANYAGSALGMAGALGAQGAVNAAPPSEDQIVVSAKKIADMPEQPSLAVPVPLSSTQAATAEEVKNPIEAVAKKAVEQPSLAVTPISTSTNFQPSTPTLGDQQIVVTGQKQTLPNAVPIVYPPNVVEMANATGLSPEEVIAAQNSTTDTNSRNKLSDIIDYLRLAGLGTGLIGSLFGSGGQQGATLPGGFGSGALNSTFNKQLPGANIPGLGGGASSGPRTAADLGQQGLNTTQDYYRYGYGPEQSFFNYVQPTRPNTSTAYTGYAKGGEVASDYDYEAARRAGVEPDRFGHMPDTYKLPNHMTFSQDSVYSTPEHEGGKWIETGDGGWVFWPSEYNMTQHDMSTMDRYFRENEQGIPGRRDSYAVYPSDYRVPSKRAKGGFAVEGPGDGREDKIPAMLSDGEYVMDAETVAMLGNGSNKAGAEMLDKFRVNLRKHKGREMARGKFSKSAKKPEQYLAGGRS